MATTTWFSTYSYTTDANFRSLGSAFSSRLATVGLIQTSDTGQINWTTATRSITTGANYEIWRSPDSSVFFKIEYLSTSTTGGAPRWFVSVGQGSNGSGTLTGIVSSRVQVYSNASTASDTTTAQNFMCFKDNYLFFTLTQSFDGNGRPTSTGLFIAAPTTDANGNLDSVGRTLYWRDSGSRNPANVQTINYQTGVVFDAITQIGVTIYCLVPQRVTSSIVGSDLQCFVHWTAMSRVYPVMQVCTVIQSEVGPQTTFSTVLVGSTPRTYMALDNCCAGAPQDYNMSVPITYIIAVLWE